jgi:hypothetical protein
MAPLQKNFGISIERKIHKKQLYSPATVRSPGTRRSFISNVKSSSDSDRCLLAWNVFDSAPKVVPEAGILVEPDGLRDVVSLGQEEAERRERPVDTVRSG